MKVFIGWSKETSKALAEIIAKWLRNISHRSIDPFCSLHDIEPGEQWTRKLTSELQVTDYGILCLTPQNLDSPWIHFEAGCLSKHITAARVCPLLFDLTPADLRGPLAQFQATRFGREGVKHLLDSFNTTLGDKGLEQDILDANFAVWWPKLEDDVSRVLSDVPQLEPEVIRSERDLLEEILSLIRSFVRSSGAGMPAADLAPLGVLRIHRQRPSTDYLQSLIKDAEAGATIRLLGVCMMGFTNAPMQALLNQKLQENCIIRFLTLAAESSFVTQKAIEEERTPEDVHNDITLSNQIHRNFIVQRVPQEYRSKIAMRHYDAPPNCFLLGTDSRMLVSFYLRGQRGEFLPHLELAVTRGGIFAVFENHFEALWAMANECIEGNT
jgi:hypothetical protein